MILTLVPKDPPLADNMRLLREDLGMSQNELAEALGFGPNGGKVVRSWESGESAPNPTSWKAMRYLSMLVAIYRAMDKEQTATALLGSMLPEAVR